MLDSVPAILLHWKSMALMIELTPQEEAQFAAYARRKGQDPAALARTLLTAPLLSTGAGAEEGAFGGKSVAERMAEIGFVAGGPPDLSTNSDFLQGFGQSIGQSIGQEGGQGFGGQKSRDPV